MERPPHNYGSASPIAYAQQQRQAASIQQQQQYGFHPQHQQFLPSVHGPPFLPPHPSQYPYHPHMQQQAQLHPRHPPHPQMLHQQPPAFPSHLPHHLVPPPFHGSYDSPPPPAAPPSDPELQKRIDKLVEYATKNGPEFEAMIREKQQDNPDYSFLFGGEGHAYYRYKLWLSTHAAGGPYNAPFPPSSMGMMHPPPNPMMNSSPSNAPAMHPTVAAMGAPQMHQPAFPPFHDQQHHLQHPPTFMGHVRPDYDQSFKGLSGPLPSDVAVELSNVLNNLSGTKESIKSAKIWFMQRSPFAPALAEALRERVCTLDDSERQLHIIYLANDILFDSLQRRINANDLDNEALAFKPVLGSMLARIYHNPQNKDENQSRLQKILQFWASKEVFDQDTIYLLENEMINGPPSNSFPGPSKDFPAAATDLMMSAAVAPQPTSQLVSKWQPDKQTDKEHEEKQACAAMPPAMSNQQFIPNSISADAFLGSIPVQSSVQPASQPPAAVEKLPPYPLFPPGLIPGMVRKTQIGSGVPYSPLSPLDIPTVIPPSDVPPSEILERVSKFFKEIGEINPSEGPMNSETRDEYDEYERESPIRKGGACIPPPPNLQVDPDTGTYTDGSVERRLGSSSSGRLGLGATAHPNEASQYDNVYTSYRKQRSTSYHSSMSARAGTR